MNAPAPDIAKIASLAMYDGGELTPANDGLWLHVSERLRAHGISGVPPHLDRESPLDTIWDGRLLFGQTCGYPFISRLSGALQIVGAPVYDLPGCRDATHRSFIVVHTASRIRRLEDLAGTRAVINEPESNSGRNLFGHALAIAGARFPFFSKVTVSGSHLQSLTAVAWGESDAAAIDCVSHAHLVRLHPYLKVATRILHETAPAPTLPFVTARENDTELVLAAVREALADPSTESARRSLRLARVESIAARAYEITREFSERADQVFGARP